MGVNKIVAGTETLIDISDKTVTPETLFEGETAKNAAGEDITGTFTLASEMTEQDSLIEQIKNALQGKAAGGGVSDPVIEPLEITENGAYTAPDGVDGYSPVTVNVEDRYNQGYADGEESKNDLEDGLLAKTLTEYRNTRPVTIGNRFFSYCYNLVSVDLPNAVYVDQYAFVYCTALKKITLPSVTTIGAFAFQDSTSLTVADFHKVDSLQSNVFTRTNLTTLILRKSDSITTNNSTAVFNSTPISKGEGFIYVPSALVDAYKTATNWSTYASQIRAIEDYPEICGGA